MADAASRPANDRAAKARPAGECLAHEGPARRSAPANFTTTIVPHADIAAALPPDTARITPGARVAEMHARRAAILRRYSF